MRSQGPLHVLRRRWVSVVLVTLVALLGGLAYVLTAPVTYQASASAFFSLTTGNSADDLVQGSTYTQNEVASFAELATSPAVLQPVIDGMGLKTTPSALAQEVQTSVPVGTVIVEVTVTDRSPTRSAQLANEIIRSLSTVVVAIAPKDDAGSSTVSATTVSPAQVPRGPSSPNVPLDLAVALVAGLVVGFGVAWLRETLDTRLRDAGALPQVTDLPVIGSVGSWGQRQTGRLVVTAAPHSPQAESFRVLRTNLQFLQTAEEASGGTQVLALTSSLAGEGKSTIACNLAATLAETGASVVLVDADLRRPAVAGILGLEGGAGLTTVLAGQARVGDVIQDWGSNGLQVLTSGAVPPNPAELLGSPAMRRLVAELRGAYDHIVIDTAPVLPVADAVVLSRIVDGVVVVAQAGRVHKGQLAHALGALEQVSAKVLGVVLNRLRREEHSYAYQAAEPPAPTSAARAQLPGTPDRATLPVG